MGLLCACFDPGADLNGYQQKAVYLAYGGCWGDNPNDGDFCQNGIISADRRIQPEMAEVKYNYQSVWFKPDKRLNAGNHTVKITNEFRFTDLSAFDITYDLVRNGAVIESGKLEVSCAPLESILMDIPYNLPDSIEPNSEYFLNFTVKLKEDNVWCTAGYVIATEQLDIKIDSEHIAADLDSMPEISLSEANGELKITGTDFEAVFSTSKGVLTSYTYNGEKIIEDGPAPNFSRAKISNDNYSSVLDGAYSKGAESFEYEVADDSKSVTINERLEISAGDTFVNMTYVVYGGGEIKVTSSLDLSKDVLEMNRYGSILTLPADYENMIYYGRGEADTYCDRKHGSHVGIYEQTVSDSFYPYCKPQDTGNKTDIRYMALTSDEKNTGILVAADGLLQASAVHYTVNEIQDARYTYNIPQTVKSTYLHVDFGSRGTGGASCGPETMSKYKLMRDGTKYDYSFTIIPFDKNSGNLDEIAGLWRE